MLRENLGLLNGWVAKQGDLVTFVPPEAGGMAFLQYHHPVNSSELSIRLRQEQSLLVLPGDVYGMDGYLRLGIGERHEVLAAGLEILGRAFSELAIAAR